MKKTFFALILGSFSFFSFGQQLGIYEFAGTGACPNQSPNVTTQPTNSEFEAFTMQNVYCVSTGNVFNTKSWNTTPDINLSEFIQFGAHTTSCFRMNLDSIIFEFRNTAAGNTPTWHLRSSIDNYASDLASGISATSTGMFRDTIILNPLDFSVLAEVKFRLYLTEMGSVGAAFRIDNVQVFGSETFVGTVDYYVDNDGDGYGTGAPTAACTNPGGYSLNNLDCDDNDAQVNPNTFWYNDADGDTEGDDSNFEIGCTSTFANPVTTGGDCDDNNADLNSATIWFEDLDGDGFGDDNTTEISCVSTTLTNPVLIGGDCSDIASDLNPNTIWYPDNDGDGFGDPNISETACISSFFVPVMIGNDCDDTREYIYPGAIEVCDEFDNDCDGLTDEGFTKTIYYVDNDADGFGNGSAGEFCSDPGINYSLNNDDCNDDDASVNPNSDDVSNDLIDQNCDGVDGYLAVEVISNSELKIFPNPGNNSMFISNNNFEKGNFSIQIIDNQGKVILKNKLDLNQLGIMEINTSEFAKGAYQIVIQNDKQIFRNSWMKI